MGWDGLFNFETTKRFHDSTVDLKGVFVTCFKPDSCKMLGYEDSGQLPGVESVSYSKVEGLKCVVDFSPKKSVFYHFNWFPDEMADLILGYFKIDSGITEDYYVRTATIENISIYGDLLFKVVRIEDDGVYSVLKRTWFLRPVHDEGLRSVLRV